MDLEATLQRFGLSDCEVRDFKGFFTLRHYAPGDTIIAEGDPAETFCVIHSGELLVTQQTPYAGERTLGVRRPGEVFGEIGLLEGIPRTASVTALSDVQLFELGKRHFLELVGANASFHRLVERLHIHRLLGSIPLCGELGDKALEQVWGQFALSMLLARAMISAAKADGQIDAQESQAILNQINGLALPAEDKAFLFEEYGRPLDIEALVRDVDSPEHAAEVYAASMLMVEPPSAPEKIYLDTLAHSLGLEGGLVQQIQATVQASRLG